MQDKVKELALKLFEGMDHMCEEQLIPAEGLSMFKQMYMDLVADIVIHFSLIVDPDKPSFELWKRNMGIRDYCLGAISELESGFNWDVNWFKHEFDYDTTPIYRAVYTYFIETC